MPRTGRFKVASEAIKGSEEIFVGSFCFPEHQAARAVREILKPKALLKSDGSKGFCVTRCSVCVLEIKSHRFLSWLRLQSPISAARNVHSGLPSFGLITTASITGECGRSYGWKLRSSRNGCSSAAFLQVST